MSKPRGLSSETNSNAGGLDRPTIKASPRGNLAKKKASMTFFIPRPTHDRMRDIARGLNTSLQRLVEEAVDEWLAKRGEPPFDPESRA